MLTGDPREISSLLHDQWRGINSLDAALMQILGYLGTDPFLEVDTYDDENISAIFAWPAQRLENALSKAVEHVGNNLEARRIPVTCWNKIREVVEELRNRRVAGNAITPISLRDKAVQVSTEIELLKTTPPKPGLNREQIAEILLAAREIERLVCIFDLHRAIDITKVTNQRALSMLRAIHEGGEKGDIAGIFRMDEVVEETVKPFRDQARIRGIEEIRVKNESRRAKVNVVKSDLVKALGNLLDNAIKYTGELSANSEHNHTWIEVRVVSNIKNVFVEIESWGVPITDEEKKGNFLSTLGYRGWFARQTAVEGSGTGLADVKNFAEKNDGGLSFDSPAVKKTSRISVYTTTTVTLTLPRARD